MTLMEEHWKYDSGNQHFSAGEFHVIAKAKGTPDQCMWNWKPEMLRRVPNSPCTPSTTVLVGAVVT